MPSAALSPTRRRAQADTSISVIGHSEKAPDFTLPVQDGNPVKLSDFRGQPVVVYFYLKAER